MKTKKRERLTALFLCMVMVATTILSNGSFVLAADTAEGATEQTSEVTGTEGLGLGTMDVAADEEKNTPEQMSEATEEITEPENTTPVETPESAGTEDKTTEQPAPAEEPAAEEPVVVAKPVVTEEPAVTAQTLYTFENDDMIVEVQLPEGTVLPEGTELQIRQITDHKITKNSTDVEKADKARFDDITELLKDVADDNGNPVDGFYAYHAELVKDKEVFVPEGEMNIKVSYKNAALPESFTGDSKLKAMNVKALNYTTVKDENDQNKTVVQDMKDHLTAFAFADNTIGSVQEIGFNGEKVTDFIVAWNGQDQTTEYTYSDGEVTVTAALSEVGILPRGVELKATKVEDKNKLAKLESALAEKSAEAGKKLSGFVTYDIRFEKDGEEIEPAGQVNVELTFNKAAKPGEDVKNAEVSLYHHEETESAEAVPTVVENAQIETAEGNTVSKANFFTDSFSEYSFTWQEEKEQLDGSNMLAADAASNKALDLGSPYVTGYSSTKYSGGDAGGNYIRIHVYVDGKNIGYYTRKFQDKKIAFYFEAASGYKVDKVQYYSKDDISGSGKSYTNSRSGSKIDTSDYHGMRVDLKTVEDSGSDLQPIGTANSKADGIGINLYNYNSGINSDSFKAHKSGFYFYNSDAGLDGTNKPGVNNKYSNGTSQGLLQGIMSRNLVDGLPTLSNGNSMEYLFEESNAVKAYKGLDGLFQKDKDGYYYYNSEDNHAQLNGTRIDLYDAKLTPHIGTFNYGNFLPFNQLPSGTKTGELASVFGGIAKTDYWYGMNVNMNFYQPKNGEINGQPMVFEFSGDDDVWVYIDGILVLDIGGIHARHGGSINFSTGYVEVTKRVGDQEVELTNTEIKEAFIDAYKQKNQKDPSDEYLNNIFTAKGTFKDYSSHTMEMIYLERGGGAANCKVKFNMPPLPKDSVTISKEISNYDEGAYSDTEFSFKLYLEQSNGEYAVVTNQNYTLTKADGNKEGSATVKDGIFKLKHGEQAQFKDIATAGTKYYVEEVAVDNNKYDQIQIESAGIVNQDDVDVADGQTSKRSKELTIGTDYMVNFKNRCAATNMKHLVIEKKMAGSTGQENFEMLVTVGGEPYVGKYKVGNNEATAGQEQTTTDGKIILKPGQVAIILGNAASDSNRGIPSGTSFVVKELEVDQEKYQEPQYQVVQQEGYKADGIQITNGYEGSASGIINIDGNAKVIVTNAKNGFDFSLIKTDSVNNVLAGAEFVISQKADNTEIQRVTSQGDGMVNFTELAPGEYTLTEASAPEGYTASAETWTLTIDQDGQATLVSSAGVEVGKLNGMYQIKNYTQQEIIETSINYEKTAKVSSWDDRTYDITINADSLKTSEVTMQADADILLLLDSSESMHYDDGDSEPKRPDAQKLGDYQSQKNQLVTSQIYYYSATESAQSLKYTVADSLSPLKYIDGVWMKYSSGQWTNMTNSDKGNVYEWKNRLSELKNAASNFINSMAVKAPECKVSLITFDTKAYDLTNGYLSVAGNKTKLLQLVNQFSLTGNTRHDLALEKAQQQLAGSTAMNKFVIMFTDGELWWRGSQSWQIAQKMEEATNTAAEIKADGTTIYTIGLSLEKQERKDWLAAMATPGLAFDTSSMESLDAIFQSITTTITNQMEIVGAYIKDVIDPRFNLLDGEGAVVTAGRIQAAKNLGKEGFELANGGIADVDDNGNIYVVWKDQTIAHASGSRHGWSKTISVKAKDEFIGGNNIPTNVAPDSQITVPGIADPLPLDQPTVNVKMDFQIGNVEDTIFWGDTVPEIENSRLFDVNNVTGVYAQNSDGKKYTIGTDGTALKASDFTLTWSKTSDFAAAVTMEDIAKETPENQTAYYLRAQYKKYLDSTGESNANTTQNGVIHVAEENNGLMASNNKTGLSKDNEKLYGGSYGVYLINVVKGQLKITKEITAQYTDIKKINANQSFIFRVDRRETTNGEIKDTYYAVLSFDANGNITEGTDTITGLKKGYYTVTEETEWSSKYSLTQTTDNYSRNGSKHGENLFIGDNHNDAVKNLELQSGQKAFYGTAPGYETYAAANPATTKFKNTLKSDWKWLSDVASAVNEFTGQN